MTMTASNGDDDDLFAEIEVLALPENDITPAEMERLVLLVGAVGKVASAASMCMRHGHETGQSWNWKSATNRMYLHRKIVEAMACIQILQEAGDVGGVSFEMIAKVAATKRKWMHHQGKKKE